MRGKGTGRTAALALLLALAATAAAASAAQAITLSGTVLDGDGRPIVGAYVGSGWSGADTTDGDGRFAFEVDPGPRQLTVHDDAVNFNEGWIYHEVDPRDYTEDTDVTITVPNRVPWTVRVVDGRGQPQPGATVYEPIAPTIKMVDGRRVHLTNVEPPPVRTDAAGEAQMLVFPVPEPAENRASLGRVIPPGATSLEHGAFDYTGPLTTVVLSKGWPDELSADGTLRDEDGPVAGARLQLGDRTAETASDGSFRFAIPPGSYAFSGEGEGWSFSGAEIDVQDTVALDLRLPARRTLTVQVRDAADASLPGAEVEVPETAGPTALGGDAPGTTIVRAASSAETDGAGEARFALFAGSSSTGGSGTVTPPPGGTQLFAPFTVPTMDADETVVVRDLGGPFGPTVALTPRPAAPGGWWAISRVAVDVVATDADLAGLACGVDGTPRGFPVTRTPTSRSGTFFVQGEGRHVAGCTAVDAGGRTGSATRNVWIDLRGPYVPGAVTDREPDYAGRGGWYRGSVEVSFLEEGDRPLADGRAGSGVDPASMRAVAVETNGVNVVSGTVGDRAGNVSPVRRVTVRVDRRQPTTTLTCPDQVALGSAGVARWLDADGESGLAGAARGTVPLDTSALGTFEADHVATDNVGYESRSECVYTVVWPFSWRGGLEAPPALNPVVPGATTVPVRFWLGGDRGPNPLRVFGTPAWVQPIACADGAPIGARFAARAAASVSFNPATNVYTYLWDLGSEPEPGVCAELQLQLDDGTERAVRFAR